MREPIWEIPYRNNISKIGSASMWEYTSDKVAPGESWYDVLRERGKQGWEAWPIEKDGNGWREIYFKRRVEN